MGAPSKRARKIRQASEFDVARLRGVLGSPRSSSAVYSWSLEDIFAARNAQMRGQFAIAARLAESTRTDDALYVAFCNRLAPQRCIKTEIVPAKGSRGASVAKEAEALFGAAGIGVKADTISDIHAALVNHEVAFGVNVTLPREDGTRVDIEHRAWPIEHVRWDETKRAFVTRLDPMCAAPGEGPEATIVHGDGRWVIYKRYEVDPFKHGAIIPAALVWARHAFGLRDWARSSLTHGLAKTIGELPAGVPLQADGALSADAAAFLELLLTIANSDLPVGIRPNGSKTEFISNSSTAWQVFNELVSNADKAAARIYLGTDGVLGAQGGAPGVDIESLFGVASTLVEGDLRCIERAIDTGVIEPWCAMNFGDSSLAPKRRYLLPDADADAARTSMATRRQAFFADVESARKNGFDITQAFINELAASHGVQAPLLPAASNKAPSIALAPTDIARVVTVNEARASAGVGPLVLADGTPDPDGSLTVEQFAAKKAAEATATAQTPSAASALSLVKGTK